MEITTINQIITATSGLLGVVIGATISGIVNYRIEHNKRDYEAKSFAAGFIAEVESLQMIIKERGYLESFEEDLINDTVLSGSLVFYRIHIPENFARFYDSNMNKVWAMGPDKTKYLIQYHQVIQAVIQDYKPESYFYTNGFNKEAIAEAAELFRMAKQLGEKIISD